MSMSLSTPSSLSSGSGSHRNASYERHRHTLSEQPHSERDRNTNPITLTRFIHAEQALYQSASGGFTTLLHSLQLACKLIATHTRQAGIGHTYSMSHDVIDINMNKSGETQKKLDVISNDILISCLSYSEQVYVMGSEENDEPIVIDDARGHYAVVYDPLDGSSNIECNLSIGTIFGIYRKTNTNTNSKTMRKPHEKGSLKDLLRPGNELVCSGYCSYDAATMLVLTTAGQSVNAFTLDPLLGEFILTHRNIRIPQQGKIYSVNEANSDSWDKPVQETVRSWHSGSYSLRYVGSMVGDIHRTLLYGGIFLYPSDKKSKNGKLRLLYECNPIAMIVEQAGGIATTGRQRILDVVPSELHQRSPIVCGSKTEVQQIIEAYRKHDAEIKAKSSVTSTAQGRSKL